MATLKKFDLSGKEIGEVAIDDKLLTSEANTQSVKDYLMVLRANARQWNASTKTRSEVSHSGQKPHPQKGTGRARQGYLGAAQYKGGGRVGGPRPKTDQHMRVNRKEKRAAIRHLLIDKIQSNQVIVLQSEKLKAPKTQKVVQFLKAQSLKGKRVLFLSDVTDEKFIKSMRNIPKAAFTLMPNASGYDIALGSSLVVFEPAVEQLVKILKG